MVQIFDHDAGMLVADFATMVGIGSANLALDGVKTNDRLQHLGGKRRLVGEVKELASDE